MCCPRAIILLIASLLLASAFSSPRLPSSSAANDRGIATSRAAMRRRPAATSHMLHHPNIKASSHHDGAVTALRGGFLDLMCTGAAASPQSLFNLLLSALAGSSVIWKLVDLIKASMSSKADDKPADVKSLQTRFLIVFWLLRMADWLQGPYFYEVYSSKIINGASLSLDMVSKLFLIGFATTGIFGPFIGRIVDQQGRRLGTLLFAALYALSALSAQSTSLAVLALGRIAGGLGTSLLFSAPEAWLVGEHQREKFDGRWLGQTFGWAYSGDALVAITAGQIASMSANARGPTGPFLTSIGFLVIGSILAALTWRENIATKQTSQSSSPSAATEKSSIFDAMKDVLADKRILLVGAVQALFEVRLHLDAANAINR
jgi:MFS transporter, MFS domain-containing protein family, molybdate-anion transporter